MNIKYKFQTTVVDIASWEIKLIQIRLIVKGCPWESVNDKFLIAQPGKHP